MRRWSAGGLGATESEKTIRTEQVNIKEAVGEFQRPLLSACDLWKRKNIPRDAI